QAEIGKVAIKRRGRPFSGLLDRVTREFEGDAAGSADALAHPVCKFEMVAVARRKVRARLCNADDGLARTQLFRGKAVIQVTLKIERGHPRVFGIVEPKLRAQATCGFPGDFRHDLPDCTFEEPIQMIATWSIPQERPRRVSARWEHFRGGYKKRARQFDDLACLAPIVRCGMNQAGNKLRGQSHGQILARGAKRGDESYFVSSTKTPFQSVGGGFSSNVRMRSAYRSNRYSRPKPWLILRQESSFSEAPTKSHRRKRASISLTCSRN